MIFKEDHVREALRLLPQIQPRMNPVEFLRLTREVDGLLVPKLFDEKRSLP